MVVCVCLFLVEDIMELDESIIEDSKLKVEMNDEEGTHKCCCAVMCWLTMSWGCVTGRVSQLPGMCLCPYIV